MTPAEPGKSRLALVAWLTFGLSLVMFMVVFIVIGTMSTGWLSDQPMPRLSITAVFVLGCAVLLAAHPLWALFAGGRAAMVVAITMVGWFPLLFAIGDAMLGEEIASGPVPVSASYLPRAATVAMVLAPMASAIWAPSAVQRMRFGTAARASVWAAWVFGVVLVGASLSRERLPDPDTYCSSLHVQGALLDGESISLGPTAITNKKCINDVEPTAYSCCLEELDTGRHLTKPSPLACNALEFSRDDANDLWIARQRWYVERDHRGVAALRGGSLEQVVLHARTLRKSLAPPIGWVLGAGSGLLIALIPLGAAIAFRRRARRVVGSDAVHRGAGLVELDGGLSVTLRDAVMLPIGPVRVDTRNEGSADYRTAPSLPTRVLGIGTVAAVKEELEARAYGASLAALVTIAMSCATLLAATAHRLVF